MCFKNFTNISNVIIFSEHRLNFDRIIVLFYISHNSFSLKGQTKYLQTLPFKRLVTFISSHHLLNPTSIISKDNLAYT
jgi:hypothetical protein